MSTTGHEGPNRALVCDDDEILRGIVRRLLEGVGYQVVAEVESVTAAVDAMGHSDVDLIVLDLALLAGRGEELLDWRREQKHPSKVVVFSAFISDAERLLDAGADVAVDKPDFNRLEEVCRQLLEAGATAPPERRRPARETPPLPEPSGRTISGFEPWASFCAAVEELSPGDAVLAIDVLPTAELEWVWDDVYRLDHRFAAARLVTETRRPPDRISLSPGGFPVLVLSGGRLEAPLAAFDRTAEQWAQTVADSVIVGVFGHVGADGDAVTLLDRVLTALQSPDTEPSSGLRPV